MYILCIYVCIHTYIHTYSSVYIVEKEHGSRLRWCFCWLIGMRKMLPMPLLRRLPSLLLTLTARLDMNGNGVLEVAVAVAAGVDVARVPGKRGRAIPQRVIKKKCIHIYITYIHIKCFSSTHTYIETYICTFRPGQLARLALRGPRHWMLRALWQITISKWQFGPMMTAHFYVRRHRPHVRTLHFSFTNYLGQHN